MLLTQGNWEQKIEFWKNDFTNIEDKRLVWDLLKYGIRKFTISFCSQKKKEKNRRIEELTSELGYNHKELASNPTLHLQQRLDDLSLQLKHIEDKNLKRDIIRSKIK